MEAIATSSVCKNFGVTKAARDISIKVRRGEIYGFLGLNGAGKTTLIRMLLGMVKPSSGSIEIFGEQLSSGFEHWNRIGYLVETPYSYPQLSVYENLKICYELRKLKDPKCIDEIIGRLKLAEYAHKKAGVLSLGNQQRLGLAKALVHHPDLLILDEPINGLDPEGIVEIRELLKELASEGVTIFISSHILSEIAKIANRIGIIHGGVILKELETTELTDLLHRKLIFNVENRSGAELVLNSAGYKTLSSDEQDFLLENKEVCDRPEIISELLARENIYPKKLVVASEDLEEFFLRTIKSN